MENLLLKEIYSNIISSAVAFIIILLIFAVFNLIIIKKYDSQRQKKKLRIRAFYIALIIFLFVIVRIWVVGFTHLLAVFGLVSAALVVTNKETIMNFVGWFVIIWRGIFSEDDLIQIQQYKGYVRSMGLLYFTIYEVSEGVNGNITGRTIRVPNGLVTTNPIINLSQTSHLLQHKFVTVITQDCNVKDAIEYMSKLVDTIVSDYYQGKHEYTVAYLNKRNKNISKRISLTAKVCVKPKQEKPYGIELTTYYYCFSQDGETIQQNIWLGLLKSTPAEKTFKLVFSDSN